MDPTGTHSSPLEIPGPWYQAVSRVLDRGARRVAVTGALDRGKSSFCRYLVDRILDAGQGVAFLDADIGQKDVGPPASLTLQYLDPGTESNHTADRFYFVGAVSPRGHLLPVALGAAPSSTKPGSGSSW